MASLPECPEHSLQCASTALLFFLICHASKCIWLRLCYMTKLDRFLTTYVWFSFLTKLWPWLNLQSYLIVHLDLFRWNGLFCDIHLINDTAFEGHFNLGPIRPLVLSFSKDYSSQLEFLMVDITLPGFWFLLSDMNGNKYYPSLYLFCLCEISP